MPVPMVLRRPVGAGMGDGGAMAKGSSWIDISVVLHPGLPVWPGDPFFEIERMADCAAGDEATVSALKLGAHTGTHLDAPSHFLAGAPGMESFSPEAANGSAQVIEIPEVNPITAEILKEKTVSGCRRVLFKTRNSSFWREGQFRSDYVFLTPEGAGYLLDRGVGLVGIDYLSIASPRPELDVHKRLLAAGVWILEGLDLSLVAPGRYDLICLPLKIADCEAAPARAYLAPWGTLPGDE